MENVKGRYVNCGYCKKGFFLTDRCENRLYCIKCIYVDKIVDKAYAWGKEKNKNIHIEKIDNKYIMVNNMTENRT